MTKIHNTIVCLTLTLLFVTVNAGGATPNWLHSICSWFGFCNEVCYGDLGCFDTSLNCHRDFFPPLPPEDINTYYVIYTRQTESEGIPQAVVRANATRETMLEMIGERRITFILHGWCEGIWKQWILDLRDALLEKRNEIPITYYNQLHLLISTQALDAAGPSFEGTHEDCRLDETDALYVDAIHTDSGKLSEGGVGISQRVGHSDFYPNGGYAQPGCRWWMVGCSHARSHLYFIESVRLPQCRFAAIPCNSEEDFVAGRCRSCGEHGCKLMGYYTDEHHNNGSFFLSTRGHSPYCTKMKFYWRRFYLLRQKRSAAMSPEGTGKKNRNSNLVPLS
nr:pancreatic lipase-related protein 2-like [Lytechinus pictus]